ncbi:MAG: IS3 family transposase [Nitrospinota bacterium]|nr:IS3 family transposase [Nitrospinota bacterium]
MIAELSQEHKVTQLCELLDIPRSSYYRPRQQKADDLVLLAAMEDIILRRPYYGYRRITQQLKRQGYQVGEFRTRRLLERLEHSCKVGKMRFSITDSRHDLSRHPNRIKRLDISRVNQVWVADITYIRLGRKFIYLAIILDAYSRGIRGWHLSRNLDKRLTITALEKALANHPAPEIHHSDQGGQYASPDYTRLLPARTQLSMSAAGRPMENGIVERFIRTFKEEHIDYTEYENFTDAIGQIAYWLEDEYMTQRIHSALAYLTPSEYEDQLAVLSPDPLLIIT